MSKHLMATMNAKLAAVQGAEWDSDSESDSVPKKPVDKKTKKSAKRKGSDSMDLDTVPLDDFSGSESDGDAAASSAGGKKRAISSKGAKSVAASSQQRRPSSAKGSLGSQSSSKGGPSTAIYLGHIPQELGEKELVSFLSQFGSVAAIHLSRSKRTSRPRGYGFVKFANPGVAEIVAKTLSGYFLGGRRLVAHVLEGEEADARVFPTRPSPAPSSAASASKSSSSAASSNTASGGAGAASSGALAPKAKVLGMHSFRAVDFRAENAKRVNRKRSAVEVASKSREEVGRAGKRLKRLKDMGIDVGFELGELIGPGGGGGEKEQAPKSAKKAAAVEEQPKSAKKVAAVEEQPKSAKKDAAVEEQPKSAKKVAAAEEQPKSAKKVAAVEEQALKSAKKAAATEEQPKSATPKSGKKSDEGASGKKGKK